MAVQLEQRYSKRTILERYLNTIYFGNGAYGVQAAAHRYFGRDVARRSTWRRPRCSPGSSRAMASSAKRWRSRRAHDRARWCGT